MVVTLQSKTLRVTIDLSNGGALTSLVDRRHSVEWLVTSQHSQHRVCGDFATSGFAGWDEMLPTIVGEGLPDHGDVWCVSWEGIDQTEHRLTAAVVSPSTGLRLERTVDLDATEAQITMSYRVSSPSDIPVPFLWAGHPLFRADKNTRIDVTPHTTWLRTDPNPAASAELPEQPLAVIPAGGSGKWWSEIATDVTGARLTQADGRFIDLVWEKGSPVKHLGVWVDNGHYSPSPTIALEPAIGWFDDLHMAIDNGTASYVSSSAEVSWQMVIRCG